MKVTLTQLAETFVISRQASGCSPRTVKFYEFQLQRFFDSLPEGATVGTLTADAIERYLAQRREEVSPRSVHCAWRAIRAFCNWLEKRDPLFANPAPYVTKPKLPHNRLDIISKQEIHALIRTCKTHSHFDDRDEAIIRVLATSGLRASELLALRVGDIDLKTGVIRVHEGKGGYDRITIIPPVARLAVSDYLYHLKERDPDLLIWQGEKGPLSYSGLNAMLRRRAKLAGIPHYSAHSFRRRWATDMVQKHGPHIVQALGGWRDIAAMKPYIGISEEELIAAVGS